MKAKASRKMGVQAIFPQNTAYILRFVNKIQEHMAAQPLLTPPPYTYVSRPHMKAKASRKMGVVDLHMV
jgi:hypothetical protein